MPNSKKCKHCGKFFTPERKPQVYCSAECRSAYYDIHYYNKVTTMKICPRCGTEFETSKPLAQTYCSPECRSDRSGPLEYLEEAKKSEEHFFASHPDRLRGYSRLSPDEERKVVERRRRSYLGTIIDGEYAIVRGLSKRPHPGMCELCGTQHRLYYHHWDSGNYSKGVWLCYLCHIFAERCDTSEEIYTRYQGLKAQVGKEFSEQTNSMLV